MRYLTKLVPSALAATLFVALAAGTLPAQFTTWYVDGVNGSDTNLGNLRSSPLRSISFAVSLAADDDRVVVLPGTYSTSTTGEVFPIAIGGATSQLRVQLIGEQGPDVTIIDMEQQSVSSVLPILRFYWQGEGSSVTGFTFTNTGSGSYWSAAIRCGSTSGGNFAAKDVEIFGNRFTNCYRGLVIFGTEPANLPNQTTGVSFHDNVLDNNAHRGVAMWGDGQNWCYNNTIVNSGHDAIWVDSLSSQPPSNAVVANNVIVGGQVGGVVAGVQGTSATYENNIAWQNAGGDYVGFTPGASNLTADPLFVGASDYHLQAGSPGVESGTLTGLPTIRLDHERFSRRSDPNGDFFAGIDRGAYQSGDPSLALQGTWDQGAQVVFDFQSGTSGGGVLAFAAAPAAIPVSNYGVYALDPALSLFSIGLGGVPTQFPLVLPIDPTLAGVTIHMQGAFVGGGGVQLLNAHERTF